MIKVIIYIPFGFLIMILLIGCTDHRDLHVSAKPMFIIKNDWSVARLNPEGATAMFFARPEPCELMYNNACRHKLYLDPNVYNILVFNEVMFSPTVSNLDGIVYRGTDQFETFGAYAKPNPVNPIFRSSPDEIMAGYGYPEPLASRVLKEKEILEEKQYIMKYQNGKNGFSVYSHFDADSIELLPIRVTREVEIVAHVRNLKNQIRVSGTLRGFAEGVLLSTRQPDGANAAYTFDLNSAVPDPKLKDGHIIVSKPFSNFGPWWNDYPSERKYILDIVATRSGEIFQYSFDVTESDGKIVTKSMSEAIVKIKDEEALFLTDGTPPAMEKIIIEVWFDLPAGSNGSVDVDMGDWGSDIIIPIPMRNK